MFKKFRVSGVETAPEAFELLEKLGVDILGGFGATTEGDCFVLIGSTDYETFSDPQVEVINISDFDPFMQTTMPCGGLPPRGESSHSMSESY
jgi:hypothetical protein